MIRAEWPSRATDVAGAALGLAAVAILAAAIAGAAGCVADGPQGRPEARPVPRQPESVQPSRMVFSVANQATDSDSNGYADLIEVSVYLFAEQYVYSVAVPGTLTFTLADRSGGALARWTFDPTQTAAAARSLPPGPGYSLRLSLRDAGGDQYDPQMAELSCEFLPANGAAIRSQGARGVRIGRLR